jgi:hypothetical protein
MSMVFEASEEFVELLPWGQIEFRLLTDGMTPFSLTGATLEEIGPVSDVEAEYDLLPFMATHSYTPGSALLGRLATAMRDYRRLPAASSQASVPAIQGAKSYVVYGPYITLPAGRYEAIILLRTDGARSRDSGSAPMVLDVVAEEGKVKFAHRHVEALNPGLSEHRLTFEIPVEHPMPWLTEVRVWSDGTLRFSVMSVVVRRLSLTPPLTAAPSLAKAT